MKRAPTPHSPAGDSQSGDSYTSDGGLASETIQLVTWEASSGSAAGQTGESPPDRSSSPHPCAESPGPNKYPSSIRAQRNTSLQNWRPSLRKRTTSMDRGTSPHPRLEEPGTKKEQNSDEIGKGYSNLEFPRRQRQRQSRIRILEEESLMQELSGRGAENGYNGYKLYRTNWLPSDNLGL